MLKPLWALILAAGCAQAQSSTSATADHSAAQKTNPTVNDLFPAHRLGDKVSLIRGMLRRVDPIHNQLVVWSFGGKDIRVNFDGRTKVEPESARQALASLTPGSLISIDAVPEEGKLFARSVRTSTASSAELSGQVARYDAAKGEMTLNDPISPEGVTVKVNSNTVVVKGGQSISAGALAPGTLVRVWLSATKHSAKEIEIIAEPGSSFTFEGRIIAVDLRSRVVSLSNNNDQSLRELTFSTLDSASLGLLREGAEVSIQAEFDGTRYNVRTVTAVPQNP